MPKSCGPGKIRRPSYRRSSYTRADGTKVPATTVKSACAVHHGKYPGRTPKAARVLPKPSGKLELSKFGYATDRSDEDRHAALREAVKATGDSLEVLRHLNLLRNYQATPEPKAIMAADVEYMSKLHAKTKNVQARTTSRKGSKKSSRKGSRKGSKKSSKKSSKKRSRKSSKGGAKKRSKKGSKKASKKRSRKSRK